MDTSLFDQYANTIRNLSAAELAGGGDLDKKMLLAREGALSVCYSPFEFVNSMAKVVVVGITPGRQQMVNAIKEARRQLDNGADAIKTLISAKQTGAFSGPMRNNLVSVLDAVGIHDWLGITSTSGLFGSASNLVHTTSVLRNPVFVNGKNNYNGKPAIAKTPFLLDQLMNGLGRDVAQLQNAVFVPMGPVAEGGLQLLASKGLIRGERIIGGLPHPSPANSERILYFSGQKVRSALSVKTNPDKLDMARDVARRRISGLR